MAYLLPVQINEHTVYIETESPSGSEDISAVETTLHKTEDAFQRAKSTITVVASDLIDLVKQMDDAVTPDEFEFEFSLKINAEGTVILTKVGGEAQLVVRMKYAHKEESKL